jgi:hypothetical protein
MLTPCIELWSAGVSKLHIYNMSFNDDVIRSDVELRLVCKADIEIKRNLRMFSEMTVTIFIECILLRNLHTILLPVYRLRQHRECITFNLFYFVEITTCFDHFIWSSSGVYKMYSKCSLELQTALHQICAHIYNDVWWMTILAIINTFKIFK